MDQVRKAEHSQRLAAGDDVLTATKLFWLLAPENMSAQRLAAETIRRHLHGLLNRFAHRIPNVSVTWPF